MPETGSATLEIHYLDGVTHFLPLTDGWRIDPMAQFALVGHGPHAIRIPLQNVRSLQVHASTSSLPRKVSLATHRVVREHPDCPDCTHYGLTPL